MPAKRHAMDANHRFPLLGEPLALDLVNTRIIRKGRLVDLLDTPAALAAWLRAEHQRLAWTGRVGDTELRAVLALRDAVDELLRALEARTTPARAAVAAVNRALSGHDAYTRLVWTRTGLRATPASSGARHHALLQTLAADAAQLLTGPEATRIRKCAHPDCRLRFLARSARRRWCSGAACGNRARVAKHYSAQRRLGRPG